VSRQNKRIKLVLFTIFLGGMFWILESAIMAFAFNEGEFSRQFFFPTPHEVWFRTLVCLFLLGFAFHADFLLTKHKKADDALQASEEKYRHLVELSPDAIAIQSEGKIVFLNRAGARLFGAEKPAQIVGRSLADFAFPESPVFSKNHFQLTGHEAKPMPIEQKLLRLDGKSVVAEVSAVPFTYDGRPAFQAIFRNVTERKRNQDQLAMFMKAVQTAREVVFLTDREGIITFINLEFTKLYGFTAEEVIGMVTPRILNSGMLSRRDYEVFWETLLGRQVVKGTWVNKCRDGRLVSVEGSANPILDDNQEIIGYLAIQHDITDRTETENKIRQRNRELDTLYKIAATISRAGSLEQVLRQALEAVLGLEWLGGGANGMLFLVDERARDFRLAAHQGIPADHYCVQKLPVYGECLCGLVAKKGEVIVSNGGWRDPQHSRRWPGMDEHKDICLPIKAHGRILGVMDIRLPAAQVISEGDIGLLKTVGEQIGLAVRNAQLYELSQKAILVERERIARDLHDDMGQMLGFVNTKAMTARLLLEDGQLDGAKKNLFQLEEAARHLSVDVRKTILDIKSSGLGKDSTSLVSILENYIAQFNLLGNLRIKLKIDSEFDDLKMPLEINAQVLRVIQEALTNIHKHSNATEGSVALMYKHDFVEVIIVDNGRGFRLSDVYKDRFPRFGLSSMQERAEELGGSFVINSVPGSGTELILSILLGIGEPE